jgi:hypothetical protein
MSRKRSVEKSNVTNDLERQRLTIILGGLENEISTAGVLFSESTDRARIVQPNSVDAFAESAIVSDGELIATGDHDALLRDFLRELLEQWFHLRRQLLNTSKETCTLTIVSTPKRTIVS